MPNGELTSELVEGERGGVFSIEVVADFRPENNILGPDELTEGLVEVEHLAASKRGVGEFALEDEEGAFLKDKIVRLRKSLTVFVQIPDPGTLNHPASMQRVSAQFRAGSQMSTESALIRYPLRRCSSVPLFREGRSALVLQSLLQILHLPNVPARPPNARNWPRQQLLSLAALLRP